MIAALAKLGATALLALACVGAAADESRVPLPKIPPAAKGERCVEPNDVMRREHMKFLLHQRGETVHEGIRGSKYSLVGCIDCHAQTNADGAPIPVNAEGQFCESCHRFAGVEVDCFGCHAAVPVQAARHDALPAWMLRPGRSIAKAGSERLD